MRLIDEFNSTDLSVILLYLSCWGLIWLFIFERLRRIYRCCPENPVAYCKNCNTKSYDQPGCKTEYAKINSVVKIFKPFLRNIIDQWPGDQSRNCDEDDNLAGYHYKYT